MPHFNSILCRYHEIAIKGRNRSSFEKRLVENMQMLLKNDRGWDFKVCRVNGRIWVEMRDKSTLAPETLDFAVDSLKRAFGLASFSPALHVAADMDAIEACVREFAPGLFAPCFARQPLTTFRIRARRSDKGFPLRSRDIEIRLATAVSDAVDGSRLKLDLDHAEITIGCEVREEFATLFFESIPGPGGLPVGASGAVLALLSGGIDSPVACYMAMKRGCPVDYVMFHSSPYTPESTVEKVKGIAAYLNRWQRGGKLYACNLAPFQKLVRDLCCEKYRTVLYRRAMLRIATAIARRRKRLALLTGESVGQVASQTVENMSVIHSATDLLILQPLVGMDKNESIRIAAAIGTFDLSNVQVPDSCTVFAPSTVTTAATTERTAQEEAKIPGYSELIESIAESAEILLGNV